MEKHDEEYILGNIEAVQKRIDEGGDIKNVSAYLMSAFEKDYRVVETEHNKAQEEKKVLALKQEQEEEEQKQALKELEIKFKNEKAAALDGVLA